MSVGTKLDGFAATTLHTSTAGALMCFFLSLMTELNRKGPSPQVNTQVKSKSDYKNLCAFKFIDELTLIR